MAATEWSTGAEGIRSHSWNKDHSLVAVCPSGSEALILRKVTKGDEGPSWQRVAALQKHEGQVTTVDWAPNSNKIITGSDDANAYVWEMKTESSWVPTLVQLRSSRAVLCAAWSPAENKFAVGSGAKTLSVCYFDSENGWWVSKVIRKKHESSVTCTAWHPNNLLLATTSTDNKCRIFSAAIKDVDPKPSADAQTSSGFTPSKFGEQLLELDLALGWAFDVAWSPSGRNLAFTGHDCSIQFIDNVGPELTVHSLFTQSLPLRAVLFLSESIAVAAGFDCEPMLFRADAEGEWSFVQRLGREYTRTLVSSERARLFGTNETEAASETVHSNTILSIRPGVADGGGQVSTFTTAGLDGNLVLWDVSRWLVCVTRAPAPVARESLIG